MITVIIPTLLRSDKGVFEYLLNQLNQSPYVTKIVIVDNTMGEFQKTFNVLGKFKIISDQNYKVNRAWNRGIKECDTDYYLIINDDVLCHYKVIEKCLKVIQNNPTCGLVTVRTIRNMGISDYLHHSEMDSENTNISTITINGCYSGNGFGWFIFGRKSLWKDIPNVEIFFGDNYIFDNTKRCGFTTMLIDSASISHFESSTVNKSVVNPTDKMRHELRVYFHITKQEGFNNEFTDSERHRMAMARARARHTTMNYPPRRT